MLLEKLKIAIPIDCLVINFLAKGNKMRANVEIRHKATLTDKKGNYEQMMMQVDIHENAKERINTKKIEKYFEYGNAIIIPLPSGEIIKVFIDG